MSPKTKRNIRLNHMGLTFLSAQQFHVVQPNSYNIWIWNITAISHLKILWSFKGGENTSGWKSPGRTSWMNWIEVGFCRCRNGGMSIENACWKGWVLVLLEPEGDVEDWTKNKIWAIFHITLTNLALKFHWWGTREKWVAIGGNGKSEDPVWLGEGCCVVPTWWELMPAEYMCLEMSNWLLRTYVWGHWKRKVDNCGTYIKSQLNDLGAENLANFVHRRVSL